MRDSAVLGAPLALVVEDDEHAAAQLAKMLEGFSVVHAADVGAARTIIESPRVMRLALIDIGLGDEPMGGLDVLDALVARRPGVPCAVITGGNDRQAMRRTASRGALFIPKPFGKAALRMLMSRARAWPNTNAPIADVVARYARAWKLSPTQSAITIALASGRKRDMIAAELNLSPNTFRTHVRRLLARCEFDRLDALVAFLLRACIEPTISKEMLE